MDYYQQGRRALAIRPPAAAPFGTIAAAAVGLAALALVNHLAAGRAERANPPRGRFITVDGVRLHCIEQGQGSPILLLHGNGATAEDFAISGVLDRLSASHRVIAIDRPGFGYSERPRARDWSPEAQAALMVSACAALGVERPVVVGHSWGTLVALRIALDHPTAVGGLALLSGYYTPTPRLDVPAFSISAIPILGDVLRYTIGPLLGWLMAPSAFKRLFQPSPVSKRFKERFPTGLSLRPSQLRATAADTAQMIQGAAAIQARLAELDLPLLIMAGTGDKIVDFKTQSEGLHEKLPRSALHAVTDAGHMVHHIAPIAVAAAIERLAARAMPALRA